MTQQAFAAIRPKLMPTEDGQTISLYSTGAIFAWLADRGRPAAAEFINQASRRWVETTDRDVVRVYRILTR